MTALDPLRRAIATRSPSERRRLAILLPLCLLLLGYWAVTHWLDSPTAVPGAVDDVLDTRLMARLPPIDDLEASTWHQAASSRGVALAEARREDRCWRLRGQIAAADDWQALAGWAAARGWWATEWRLSRQANDGFTFAACFVASLEKETLP